MAANDALAYGVDVASVVDADALFTEAVGLDVVKQDAIHRLSTDNILGPDGEGWGYNTVRLLGMPDTQLAGMSPILSEVLLRDERIDTADVAVQPFDNGDGTRSVRILVECDTALGPFSFVKAIGNLTLADLEGTDT